MTSILCQTRDFFGLYAMHATSPEELVEPYTHVSQVHVERHSGEGFMHSKTEYSEHYISVASKRSKPSYAQELSLKCRFSDHKLELDGA